MTYWWRTSDLEELIYSTVPFVYFKKIIFELTEWVPGQLGTQRNSIWKNKKINIKNILCTLMFCLCVCVCVSGLLWLGLQNSFELPCWCWELNPSPLEEWPVLITAEPLLWVPKNFFHKKKTTCRNFHLKPFKWFPLDVGIGVRCRVPSYNPSTQGVGIWGIYWVAWNHF